MTFIVFTIFLLVVMACAMVFRYNTDNGSARFPRTPVLAMGVGIFLAMFLMFSLHSVQSGDVGVVRTFGKITGQTGSGLVMTLPIQDFDTTSVQVRRYDDNNLTAATKDVQNAYARVTVNYQVSPLAVQQLLTTVGPNYMDVLVLQRVQDFFKSESVKYVADDTNLNDPTKANDPNYHSIGLLQNRETIRQNVKQQLTASLAPYSITVTDLFLTDVHFDDAFTKAIESKQVAQQDALAEQNKVAAAQAKGDQAKAEAQGQAAAIDTVNKALGNSPDYVSYLLAQAQVTEANRFADPQHGWDGHLPEYVGTGQNSPGILLPIPGSGK